MRLSQDDVNNAQMYIGGGGMMMVKTQSNNRETSMKNQISPDTSLQQYQNFMSLFGIRRPLTILNDTEYKKRVMLDEMVLA